MATPETGLSRKHVGAAQHLNCLVLVGFSIGSRSPDMGIRMSGIAPGRSRVRSRGPARRREIFGTHIYRTIVSTAIVSRGLQVCPRRQTTMLRVTADSRVSSSCGRPSRRRRVEPVRSRRRRRRRRRHSGIFPVAKGSRSWCSWRWIVHGDCGSVLCARDTQQGVDYPRSCSGPAWPTQKAA